MKPQAWSLVYLNAKLVRDEALGDGLSSFVEKDSVNLFLMARIGCYLNEIESGSHSAENYAEIIDTLYYMAKQNKTNKMAVDSARKVLKDRYGGLGDHNVVVTSRWNDTDIISLPATVYETEGPDTYIVVKEGLACKHYIWKNPHKGGDHSISAWSPFPNWPTVLKTMVGESFTQLKEKVVINGVIPFVT